MAYNITYLNQIVADLGGSDTYIYEIDALNAICTLLGITAGHTYKIDALNAIEVNQGGSGGHKYNIDALNSIIILAGKTGGYKYEPDAWAVIQQGALLNQTFNPYFALPETGVTLIAGETVTIFGDSIVNVPNNNNLEVTYVCAFGTASGNNLILEPLEAHIGSNDLTITVNNGNTLIGTYTIAVTVEAVAVAGAVKVLCIGDSTTAGHMEAIGGAIDGVLAGKTLTYIGTQGTTRKHEGYGGYTYHDFAVSEYNPSPFFKAGVLNVSAYFTDNSIDTPDIVYMRCGINDIFSGYTNAQIVSYIDILVNAFLAFDANLKVIIAIPTTATNDIDMFLASYPTRDIDLTIEKFHIFWQVLVNKYSNAQYNARVGLSYEAINFDRSTGYLNAVHQNAIGDSMIGAGLAPYINTLITAKIAPTGLTAVWENDYAKIDFTDNTGGAATHEIWESKNGGAYTLVTTLAAGTVTYNNYTQQNATMNFKVRAKSGAWLSEYTESTSLVTPLVFKTNQSTLVNVVLNILYIAAGKTVNVNWGDGTNANYTGDNASITKTYSVENASYFIIISGDINYITRFYMQNQTHIFGDMTKWNFPPALAIRLNANGLTGNLSGWVLPTSLGELQLSSLTGYTGDISGWVLPSNMTTLYLNTLNIALSGNLSGWSIPAGMTRLYISENDFTGIPQGELKDLDSTIGLYMLNNNCNTAAIDAFLAYADNYFTTVTPIKSSLFKLDGVGMGIPSAAGLASRSSIQAKFVAAGFVATIAVNS